MNTKFLYENKKNKLINPQGRHNNNNENLRQITLTQTYKGTHYSGSAKTTQMMRTLQK